MDMEQLKLTAKNMVQAGKGILAADESTPTCTKRFNLLGIESTDLNRNKYRDLLFTTPKIEEFISGVIMFDETLRQKTLIDNIPFPEFFKSKGIIPGIKVDLGAKQLALHSNEKITEGLDGLRERLDAYYKLGARFAKWRAVITINDKLPSSACIHANAHALARYAALCQEASIVPIVEPEVLMDGTHTIDNCHKVSEKSFNIVFQELENQNVLLEGIVLKPNMIVPGNNCSQKSSVEEVADRTVECLKKVVPSEVPGCAFLSGGQSNEDATLHLNKMNEKYRKGLPWNLTFSFGRALQSSALEKWSGRDENIPFAKDEFYKRAEFNSWASLGDYNKNMEELSV